MLLVFKNSHTNAAKKVSPAPDESFISVEFTG